MMKNKVTSCENKLANLNLEPLQNAEEVKGGTLGLIYHLLSYKKSIIYGYKSYGGKNYGYGSKGYGSKSCYCKDND